MLKRCLKKKSNQNELFYSKIDIYSIHKSEKQLTFSNSTWFTPLMFYADHKSANSASCDEVSIEQQSASVVANIGCNDAGSEEVKGRCGFSGFWALGCRFWPGCCTNSSWTSIESSTYICSSPCFLSLWLGAVPFSCWFFSACSPSVRPKSRALFYTIRTQIAFSFALNDLKKITLCYYIVLQHIFD